MSLNPEIISSSAAGRDGEEIVPFQNIREMEQDQTESDEEAESKGPDEEWKFWNEQIQAGLLHERRWRQEAMDCEELYFGPDNDPGTNASGDGTYNDQNRITDKVALIHSNIEVLKPMLYSDTPQPVVRRRFRGDGKLDETDVMAAEAGQRLATFILDTEEFDNVMAAVRDDYLIAGRGAGRIFYRADVSEIEMPNPLEPGKMIKLPVKTSETVTPSYAEWRRVVLAPSHNWDRMPWIAFETPMTRSMIQKRFGEGVAEGFSFNNRGLVQSSAALSDADRDKDDSLIKSSETGDPAINRFDTAMVWEIWDKDRGQVIWFSPSYTTGVVDREDDPLGLEDFWPMPKPLVSTVKGQQLTPRPPIKYYERRAKEIDIATEKLKIILDSLSVSGLFPGQMSDQVQQLLQGESKMIPVESWIALMEKGGTNNIIQWLPLQHMIQAIQALITLREQAKQAMFEASGVSDIMRAQGDPNETATAQNLKGRYAGLRLSDQQRHIAVYARDLLRLLIEVALEHFDTEYLADITGLDLPMTEEDRMAILAEQQMAQQQWQAAMQQYQQAQQVAQMAEAAGLQINPIGPPPEEPKFDRVPETSWELVHERLRSDYKRKITVTIETSSTILADEQADKDSRVEFLKAFTMFVKDLMPLASQGVMDFKTAKELLMFGIRGFPKSRTLESLIAALPDEPQGEPPEDTQITVTKMQGEIDKMLKEMEIADKANDRDHEMKMKGVELVADAADMASTPTPEPAG